MRKECIICGDKINKYKVCKGCREIVKVILINVFEETGGNMNKNKYK